MRRRGSSFGYSPRTAESALPIQRKWELVPVRGWRRQYSGRQPVSAGSNGFDGRAGVPLFLPVLYALHAGRHSRGNDLFRLFLDRARTEYLLGPALGGLGRERDSTDEGVNRRWKRFAVFDPRFRECRQCHHRRRGSRDRLQQPIVTLGDDRVPGRRCVIDRSDTTVNYSVPLSGVGSPGFSELMSVGDGFSYQTPGNLAQQSTITVDGRTLTQSAGGMDDGQAANGALITVGHG